MRAVHLDPDVGNLHQRGERGELLSVPCPEENARMLHLEAQTVPLPGRTRRGARAGVRGHVDHEVCRHDLHDPLVRALVRLVHGRIEQGKMR
jgi:hypothetical protein